MNKKKIIILIISLIFIVLLGVFTKMPAHTERTTHELQVSGFFIEFEDGTTESEVKDILESCNMPLNYSIDYNSDIMLSRYYITVDNNKTKGIMDELRKENWTDIRFDAFKKGNSYIIPVTIEAIGNESFLEIMKKNDLQVKKSILCIICFEDGSTINWMNTVNKISSELEKNEKVLIVSPNYIEW